MAATPRVATPRTGVAPRAAGETIYQVDGQEIRLSPAAVKQYLVQGSGNVSDQEVMMFMALCKAQKLNPFVKDAYLIKYGSSPATVVTAIGALEKRACDFPEFDGIKSGIIVRGQDGGYEEREGAFYDKAAEQLVGGWAEIKRKDRTVPTHVSLSLDEYIQTKSDGTPNSNWAGKPATMIRKCAKAAAYREAFPKQNAQLYDIDEIKAGTYEALEIHQAPAGQPDPQLIDIADPNTGEIYEDPKHA